MQQVLFLRTPDSDFDDLHCAGYFGDLRGGRVHSAQLNV